MGDRALVIFTDGTEYSPGIYLHWQGREVADLLAGARSTLRKGDTTYSAARFAAHCCNSFSGNTGVGVFNTPYTDEPDWNEITPGDNGIFVVNVETGKVERFPQTQQNGGFSIGELPA